MIRLDALSVDLGKRRVLRDISLNLARGRVTAILGPNGAGKTSLLRAVAGLLPSAGAVSLDGHAVTTLPLAERARRIGYLPQNGQPAWAITVHDLVALGRLPHRSPFAAPSPEDEAAINAAMTQTDILHLAERTVDTLSGGEKARAKFARVLAGESDWILADEPLASLDPPHQRDVLHLMRAAADAGKGVIVVLHQLEAAARMADDVLVLKDGGALAFGPTAEVLTPATLAAAFDMPMDVIEHQGRIAILPH